MGDGIRNSAEQGRPWPGRFPSYFTSRYSQPSSSLQTQDQPRLTPLHVLGLFGFSAERSDHSGLHRAITEVAARRVVFRERKAPPPGTQDGSIGFTARAREIVIDEQHWMMIKQRRHLMCKALPRCSGGEDTRIRGQRRFFMAPSTVLMNAGADVAAITATRFLRYRSEALCAWPGSASTKANPLASRLYRRWSSLNNLCSNCNSAISWLTVKRA